MAGKTDKNKELTPIEDADRMYFYWKQKKRPALPETRAGLLELAREKRSNRYDDVVRLDGRPLTAEDRIHIRKAQIEGYRAGKAHVVAMENEIERQFWQLLISFGLYPEGGLQ